MNGNVKNGSTLVIDSNTDIIWEKMMQVKKGPFMSCKHSTLIETH